MKESTPIRHRLPLFAAPLLLAAFTASSCTSGPYGYGGYQASPAQRGAVTGAVAGGIIGGIAREDIGGAAIGAGLGALAGAATAQAIENNRRRQTPPYGYEEGKAPAPYRPQAPQPPYPPRDNRDNRDYRPIDPPPQPEPYRPPAPQRSEQQYPTAKKTPDPNRVISPYPPNNMIDVEGFSSGDLAIDPTTEKIFRIP